MYHLATKRTEKNESRTRTRDRGYHLV